MIIKLRQWISKYYSWILTGILGFQLYIVYAVNFELIPNRVNLFFGLFILLALPIISVILFLINWKRLSSDQITLSLVVLSIEVPLIMGQAFAKTTIDTGPFIAIWIAFMGLCILLNVIKQALQRTMGETLAITVSFIIFLAVIGLFEQSWWTLIPLTAAVLTFILSKDFFFIISDIEITEKDISFSLKKKWALLKFIILIVSVLFYPAIIFSDFLVDFGVIKWGANIFFEISNNEKVTPFQYFYLKGAIRIFIFSILFYLIKIIHKFLLQNLSYYKNLINEYKKVIEEKKANKEETENPVRKN